MAHAKTFKCPHCCDIDLSEVIAFGRGGFGVYLYCPSCNALVEKMREVRHGILVNDEQRAVKNA